jgi:hypothetical protein
MNLKITSNNVSCAPYDMVALISLIFPFQKDQGLQYHFMKENKPYLRAPKVITGLRHLN